jgi:hypothetical protein
MPVMNNVRLEKFSQRYQSDSFEVVESKCFFLFAGSDNRSGAFSLTLNLQVPDDPLESKFVETEIRVENLLIEQCSDIVVSLIQIIPDFKTVLRYDDLHPKSAKLDLEKMIKRQTPLFYLRKEIIRSKYSDTALNAYITKLMLEKKAAAEAKDKRSKEREEVEKKEKMLLSIQKLDKQLK